MVASTDELRRDLVEKLQSHHEEIVTAVRQRSETELRRPPNPGEWSALQQLEHLLLADDIWTAMALRAATEQEPDLAELWARYRVVEESNPFPPPGNPRTLDELVAALQERHRQTLAIVDATPLEALSRVGRNTGWGDLTVQQMLRGVYRHYRMHIDQIEQREQSFTPRRAE
ncbi:MAG: DinB family protein [Dehalococcoidia bacterium]|nr:DinB family protein [Dehalococcoidia bacterium]